jgi:hypothetical protein
MVRRTSLTRAMLLGQTPRRSRLFVEVRFGLNVAGIVRCMALATGLDQFAVNESRHFIHRQRGFRNDPGIELEVMPHARELPQQDADACLGQSLGKTRRIVAQNLFNPHLNQRRR